jgi:SAM-dependent methyltransferase
MGDGDRETLRHTFNEAAELYDRARPAYPAQLYRDLAAATGRGRLLEIGCGTGKATVPLAERGHRIVAVELGAELAAVARRNLARFERVEVVTANFEEWPLPAEPFDVVFSACAFHWIDPAIRGPKSAAALRPGGVLAVAMNNHIAGGSTQFFADVQACYERFDPSTPPGLRLETADEIPRDDYQLSGPFGPPTWRRYEWELPYSRSEYRDLLLTYSGHRTRPAAAREGLLRCIDAHHSGRIVKRYLTELMLATKLFRR